jgi:hypothetical protein
MQQSSELRDLMIRYWEAFAGGDVANASAHLSADSGILGIGTDPGEWYEGAEVRGTSKRTRRDRSAGLPTDPPWRFPVQCRFSARFTAVAHREDGVWRLVQAHTSVGVPNDQVVGQPLPS